MKHLQLKFHWIWSIYRNWNLRKASVDVLIDWVLFSHPSGLTLLGGKNQKENKYPSPVYARLGACAEGRVPLNGPQLTCRDHFSPSAALGLVLKFHPSSSTTQSYFDPSPLSLRKVGAEFLQKHNFWWFRGEIFGNFLEKLLNFFKP